MNETFTIQDGAAIFGVLLFLYCFLEMMLGE